MNWKRQPVLIVTGAIALAVVFVGCRSHNVAFDTAQTAHRHLVIATEQIEEKIEAENRYYDDILRAIEDGAARVRSDELIDRITQLARSHVQTYRDRKARDASFVVTTDWVEQLLNAAVTEWADADARRDAVVSTAMRDLLQGRRALEVERSKLGQLKSQLAVLARGRDDQQMFKFLMRYAQAVKDQYDTQKEEAEAAAAADAASAVPGSPGMGSE